MSFDDSDFEQGPRWNNQFRSVRKTAVIPIRSDETKRRLDELEAERDLRRMIGKDIGDE